MREWKAARRGDALEHDGGAEELGDLDELGEGVAVRDRVAGDDQGRVGGHEPLGGRVDGRAITHQARGDARRRQQVEVVTLGVEHVDGQGEEHRPARLRERSLHGASHESRQVLEPPRLRRPLHERRRDGRQIGPEDGLRHRERLIVLPGREQQRPAGLVGGIHLRGRVRGEVRQGGFEQWLARRGHCPAVVQLS